MNHWISIEAQEGRELIIWPIGFNGCIRIVRDTALIVSIYRDIDDPHCIASTWATSAEIDGKET